MYVQVIVPSDEERFVENFKVDGDHVKVFMAKWQIGGCVTMNTIAGKGIFSVVNSGISILTDARMASRGRCRA